MKLANNSDKHTLQSHVLWNNGTDNNLPGILILEEGVLSFKHNEGKGNAILPVTDIQNVRLTYPLPRPGAGGFTEIHIESKNGVSEYSFTIMDWLVSKSYGVKKEERANDEFDYKRWLEIFKENGASTSSNASTSIIMTTILALFLLGLILNTVL